MLHIRPLIYCALLSLVACHQRTPLAPSRGDGQPLVVMTRSVLKQCKRRFGSLKLLAAFELRSTARHFGGLSGLAFSRDGKDLLLVSDRGRWYRTAMVRDSHGVLLGFRAWRSGPLLGVDASPLAGRWLSRGRGWDAEAVATAAGVFYVAFESAHRVLAYRALGSRATELRLPPSLYQAPGNQGIEAMTVLADGRLFAISEGLFNRQALLRGWLQRSSGGAFVERDYKMSDAYLPTDLAPLADGGVLLLERMYVRLPFGKAIGPHARIRHIPPEALRPGAKGPLIAKELGRLDEGLLDNFEGLALQRHKGRVLLYIVSDDNFSSSQKTLLFQLSWQPNGA